MASVTTSVDPCTDLSGFVIELVEGIKRLGTDDTSVVAPVYPPTTVPVVDCTAIVRDVVVASPFFDDPVIECFWTQGSVQGDSVLALGRASDQAVWCSLFSLDSRKWSDAFVVPELTGVGLGATARRAQLAVFCVARLVKVFVVTTTGMVCVASSELPRVPEAMAISEDGQLVAVIMEDHKELWLFRYTEGCLALSQTLPADEHNKMTTLAFNPSGTRLGVADDTGRIVLFAVDRAQLMPITDVVGQLGMLPTGRDLLEHYAKTEKAPVFELDERALWIDLPRDDDDTTAVLATQHHLALVHTGQRHFIMDKGYAVATLVHDQFWTLLDAAGMVVIRDYADNMRHALAPEQRGRVHDAYKVACSCEACGHRSRQPPSTLSRPVVWISTDGATLVIVDQWAVARIASASAGSA